MHRGPAINPTHGPYPSATTAPGATHNAVVPNWYHATVALNIRLTEAEETALTELATVEGISKNDVVRRAILDRHARTIRRHDVDEATNWAREHYRSLLDRLAQ